MSKDISRRLFVSFVKFVFSKIIRPEWRPHSGETQIFFWQKNIRTYFCLTPIFYISRRRRRNRRNSLAHFYYFTRKSQNSQNFTRSARSLLRMVRGVATRLSVHSVISVWNNKVCVCLRENNMFLCSSVKIIKQKRRGALRSSLYYLLCVLI